MNNVTHWKVPADHPAFAGHFPGNPTVPGVVLLDQALHAIAASLGISLAVCEISAVKFLSPVAPGDELLISHTLLESGAIRFEILSGTQKIAEGRILPGVPASTQPV